MLTNNLSDFTKLEEVFSNEEKDLSLISHCGKFYHNLESLVKCPRCENLGELIESGLIRSLYRCDKCGIFSKLTKKQGIITAVDRTDRTDCQIPTKKPQLLLLAAVLSSPKKEIKNVQLP
jgi:acetyl-CoA carboxylase beta subunit